MKILIYFLLKNRFHIFEQKVKTIFISLNKKSSIFPVKVINLH